MITNAQLGTYKKLISDIEKYNYYFTNDTDGQNIIEDSLFYQSYLKLEQGLKEEIKSKKYNTLILLVGFSVQPLVLSISVLKPKKVYLLFSNETKHNCSIIYNWSTKSFEIFKKENKNINIPEFIGCNNWEDDNCEYLINSSEPNDTYKKILSIIENEKSYGKIAIDITGGKKTMVSGAFIAASMTGTDALYVDFGDYDGSNPVPGTEFLRLQKNPITDFLANISTIFGYIKQGGWISKEVLSINYQSLAEQLVSLNLLKRENQDNISGYKPYPFSQEP